MTYSDFLASKTRVAHAVGPGMNGSRPHQSLHDWQSKVVGWAAARGRAAVWLDTGLGKTRVQVEWLRLVTGDGLGLIVAPLAVAQQTVAEAERIGVDVRYVREQPTGPGLYITNYEMLERFDPAMWQAMAMDESSRLKDHTSKTRQQITRDWAKVPFILCCSATPAPNDVTELCTHAELLTSTTRAEMLAAYFVHDDSGWRMKGHASEAMWRWISSWAVAASLPSDLGDFSDEGYVLAPLQIHRHTVDVAVDSPGQLFATELGGIGGRARVRRETLDARVAEAVATVATSDEQWMVWCNQNVESSALAAAIPDSVEITGSMAPDEKASRLMAWLRGEHQVLITKPSIAGHGINAQQCHRMVFVGLSDSYEQYYQAIRRCHRYGQTDPVDVHVVVSELESQIVDNIRRKETQDRGRASALARYSRLELARV